MAGAAVKSTPMGNLLGVGTTTPNLIYAAREKREHAQPPRPYMGISSLGEDCDRLLWLQFRWAFKYNWDGKMLGRFDRGFQREDSLLRDLAGGIGVALDDSSDPERYVLTRDPDTGRQFRVEYGAFVSGHCDAVVKGLAESQKPHVIDIKSVGKNSFEKFIKSGVEKSNRKYFVQLQAYGYLLNLDKWGLLAENADSMEMYFERGDIQKRFAEAQLKRGDQIAMSDTPPKKQADPMRAPCKDPLWKTFCPAFGICHEGKAMVKSCRTCWAGKPGLDGFYCHVSGVAEKKSCEQQLEGCELWQQVGG